MLDLLSMCDLISVSRPGAFKRWCKPHSDFILILNQLYELVLARLTIKEDIPGPFPHIPSLRTLHVGLAYHWGKECPLLDGAAILECLHSVSRTTEVLSFYLNYYPASLGEYYFHEADAKHKGPFRYFLLQFPRLRSMNVPITMLLDTAPTTTVDIRTLLPNIIQYLCLQ